MVKRVLAFTCVLAILLCGCSNSGTNDTSASDDSIATTPDNAVTEDTNENSGTSIAFGYTLDEAVAALQQSIAGTSAEGLLTDEYTKMDQEATEIMPANVTYGYAGPGKGYIMYFCIPETDEVYQICYSVTLDSLDTTELAKQHGALLGALINAYEPSEAIRQKLDSDLDVLNLADGTNNVSSGTASSWSYSVYSGQIMFNIMSTDYMEYVNS
ncbi:hypothetical protein ACTQ34_07190 [Agathobaculum sp. LCP25S3_E8]|uniref:hypothetical protein n=1 Tax=Agathobaculum sp. LCP25S3_E8 TaxID=3438735 RepID=UPI003F901C87